MTRRLLTPWVFLGAVALLGAGPGKAEARAASATLRVEGERFLLITDDGRRLTSPDLVGAVLTTETGAVFRLDAVESAEENPKLLLHIFSVQDPQTGAWTPLCEPDAKGRRAGLPIAGAFDEHGRYVKDVSRWFLGCIAGARAKCVVWGYDPWSRGPHGEDLADYYRACQRVVRADYDGSGLGNTRNGTPIVVFDGIGIQADDRSDPRFVFEAGWGAGGAVCVATTRWPDLMSLDALRGRAPRLDAPCDEPSARRGGALIYTRVLPR